MNNRPYTITHEDLLGKTCKLNMSDHIVVMCPACYDLWKLKADGEIKVTGNNTTLSSIDTKLVISGECPCGHTGRMILLDDLIADAVMALNMLQYYTNASCCSHNDAVDSPLYIEFVEKESFSDIPVGWSQSKDGKRLFSNCEREVALNNLYSWLYTLKRCGKD